MSGGPSPGSGGPAAPGERRLRDAWEAFAKTARPFEASELEGPIVAFVPHADDETLGFGGLYRELLLRGTPVDLVLVTDGTGSHPGATGHDADARRDVREGEFRAAVEALGGETARLRFWRKPDTRLPHLDATEEKACVEEVRRLLDAGGYATVLTPWRRDPHGDHRAITSWVLAARRTADAPAALLEYCVWLGQQGSVGDFPVAARGGLVRVNVSAHVAAKRAALRAHRSQLGRVFDDPAGFTLPESLAATVERDYEYFLRS